MRKIIAIAAMLVIASVTGADSPKPVYKTIRLSLNDVAISCKTGKQPLVDTKTDGTYVIVTCE